MIDTHPASEKLKQVAKEQGTNIFALLTTILEEMVKDKNVPFMSYLTKDYYLYPDLHGKCLSLLLHDFQPGYLCLS